MLQQGIGQKVNIRRKLAALEIAGFPDVFVGRSVAALEFVEYKLPGIARSRSAYFPEIAGHHSLEIFPVGAVFRPMEDRFSTRKFLKDKLKLSISGELRL